MEESVSLKRRPRIYVAGPYSGGDSCINTHNAIKVGNTLWMLGYAPFIPHLTHFWHTITPKTQEEWMEYDKCFLGACDAVFRITGHSPGSDAECVLAEGLGIPVFYTYESLHIGLKARGLE